MRAESCSIPDAVAYPIAALRNRLRDFYRGNGEWTVCFAVCHAVSH